MQTYNFSARFTPPGPPDTPAVVTIEGINSSGITPSFPVPAPQGISLITFALDANAVEAGVTFPSSPIQWLNDDLPTTLPPWFVMHWHDAHHFALWDFNSAPVATQHHFVVSVCYQSQFYSSTDPTIINQPPSGG